MLRRWWRAGLCCHYAELFYCISSCDNTAMADRPPSVNARVHLTAALQAITLGRLCLAVQLTTCLTNAKHWGCAACHLVASMQMHLQRRFYRHSSMIGLISLLS